VIACIDCKRPFNQRDAQAYFTLDAQLQCPRKVCYMCLRYRRRAALATA
jgi:hypothetical protein